MAITIDVTAFTDSIGDRAFARLCANNPETKFETTKEGKLIVMSPTGSESGKKNADLLIQIGIWNRRYKLGVVFDSSTGFKLSNGATRSPDVSWIKSDRWNSLTLKQQKRFAPIDPDFVIELVSPTDNLLELQQKMVEYINSGVKLGWLIDPEQKQVEIYRIDGTKEVLNCPSSLSGENILPELNVDLAEVF